MGKNEENEDASIATSSRGIKKFEHQGSRIIELKIEDLGLKTRNLGKEMFIV